MLLQAWILPNSLNSAEEESESLTPWIKSNEEQELLEGYNLLEYN